MSATLVRDGHVVRDDYAVVADDAELPVQGALMVSLARWTAEHEALAARGERVGVRVPNTANIAAIGASLLPAATLALEFPSFADGRAYSQARALRDRFGYRGELRAVGAAVVRDQLHGMLRCGFDAFEPRSDQAIDTFLSALRDFTIAYQPAADDLPGYQFCVEIDWRQCVAEFGLRRGSGYKHASIRLVRG